MRKIINGKLYDTEKAEKIDEYWKGRYGDAEYFEETLYKNSDGTFFIYGYGGAYSKYGRISSDGNGYTDSSSIIVLSEEETKDWLETYGDVEIYLKLFPLEEGHKNE